jgi:hypothetical protein
MEEVDDIYIDRLVIDLPGMTGAQAKELSKQVGAGLAGALSSNQAKAKTAAGGSFGTLTVDLNEQAASRSLPRLAEEIVSSLLRQIG